MRWSWCWCAHLAHAGPRLWTARPRRRGSRHRVSDLARRPWGSPAGAPSGARGTARSARTNPQVTHDRHPERPPRPAGSATGKRVVQIPWRLRDRNLRNRKEFCPGPSPCVAAFHAADQCVCPRLHGVPAPLPPEAHGGVAFTALCGAPQGAGLREFTNPPLASAPPVGGLADVVFDHAQEDPLHIALGRKDEQGQWRDVTVRRVPRRGARAGQGAARAGHPVRGPGRDHVPYALRVDALRLRAVDDRRPGRARLPDLLGRAGLLDAARRRRCRPRWWSTRTTR